MSIILKKYPNNFQIVYENSSSNIQLTSIYIICDIGPVYEYDKIRGASHFIEHMCFKGTHKITHAKDIFQEYSKIGAYFNAYTSKRYTCYTVKCQDEYVNHCLNILSDMLMNSLFNKKEYEKEEKVVIEENNNNNNDPEKIIDNEIERILYKGSSYEFPIDSLEYHTSRSLNYKDVIEFYKTFYNPSNMILSVVSNLSFQSIDKIIKKTIFTKHLHSKFPLIIPVIHHGITSQKEIEYKLIEKRGITNIHLNIAFRTCGQKNKDKFALDILSNIMGNSLTGRLMMLLRERKGLVYGAYTSTDYNEYSGNFTFYTKTKRSHFLKYLGKNGVLPLMLNIIHNMIKNGVTEKELETAKGNFKGNSMIELQNITTQTQYNGEYVLMGNIENNHIVPYKDIFKTYIQGLSLEDINKIIKLYFTSKNMCVCILSEKIPDLETIQKEFKKIF